MQLWSAHFLCRKAKSVSKFLLAECTLCSVVLYSFAISVTNEFIVNYTDATRTRTRSPAKASAVATTMNSHKGANFAE